MAAWQAALLADLAHEAAVLPGRTLGSIFFGGGTPSLMPPALVAALIDAGGAALAVCRRHRDHAGGQPHRRSRRRALPIWRRPGVNRVSLGLQALDDAALAFSAARIDVDEGLRALDTAQASISRACRFDLIYARPGQSLEQWEAELGRALGFGTGHLSLYQLTIEPGTRFETLVRRGDLVPADDDHCADLFELTRAMTAAAGLPAYEISNHARPGEESRHNLTYWRYGDYAGIGPGAHGRRGAPRHRAPPQARELSRGDRAQRRMASRSNARSTPRDAGDRGAADGPAAGRRRRPGPHCCPDRALRRHD